MDNLSLLVAAASTLENHTGDSASHTPARSGDHYNNNNSSNSGDQYNDHSSTTTSMDTSAFHWPMDLDDDASDRFSEGREWTHKKYRPFHHSKPRTRLWYPPHDKPPVKVTVTDVTCNRLRVTFVESPTDQGFFNASMDT